MLCALVDSLVLVEAHSEFIVQAVLHPRTLGNPHLYSKKTPAGRQPGG